MNSTYWKILGGLLVAGGVGLRFFAC